MKITLVSADGVQEAAAADLTNLLASEDATTTLWVDMTGPSDQDIQAMRDVFGFHPMAIRDTRNERQRPKLDEYADTLFVIVNPVSLADKRLVARELDIFIGRNYVVTVHPGHEPAVAEARERAARAAAPLISPTYLLYLLLDVTVDGYFPILDSIGEQIERVEQVILTDPHREVLNDVLALKRILTELGRVVWPQRDVAHTLASHTLPLIDQERLKYYLADISDHLLWITDMTNNYRDVLTGVGEMYMSAISLRLSRSVSRLTILAVIMGVLTVISAFYGMNFTRTWPPYSAPWGVVAVVALMAFITLGLLTAFRRLE